MNFWRKWLRKWRRESDKEILKKRGLWGPTPETILWLLDELELVDPSTLTFERRLGISFRTFHPNIDVLVIQTNAFVVAIKGEDYISYIPNEKERVRNLDEFLVSVNERSITPENALKALLPPVRLLVEDLLMMRSEEHDNLGYYLRRGEKLLSDIHVFLSALVESQD